MPGPEIAAVMSCLVDGQWFLSGQRTDPLKGLEADGSHDDQLARHRLEQQLGLSHHGAQLGFDAGRTDQFFQVLQPRAALAAKCDGIRFAGIQTIDEGVTRGQDAFVVAGLGLVVSG